MKLLNYLEVSYKFMEYIMLLDEIIITILFS
jgi:uncharacterized protein YpiB (UPF0302 family)